MKLDAASGTIEIEADAEVFERVATRAAELLSSLQRARPSQSPDENEQRLSPAAKPSPATSSEEDTPPRDGDGNSQKQRKPRKKGGGKVKGLKIIDGFLSEEQRISLRQFYNEKAPKNQPEIVAVVCVKLKELTGKDRFTQDEVHTAIQAVNQKTPANLSAVFNNMTSRYGYGNQDDGMFVPNFKCDDFVKHDLPKQKGSDD
jgi:hypothetical protein